MVPIEGKSQIAGIRQVVVLLDINHNYDYFRRFLGLFLRNQSCEWSACRKCRNFRSTDHFSFGCYGPACITAKRI